MEAPHRKISAMAGREDRGAQSSRCHIWSVDLGVKNRRIRNGNFPSLWLKRDLSQQLEHVSALAKIMFVIRNHYACQAESIKLWGEISLDGRNKTTNIQASPSGGRAAAPGKKQARARCFLNRKPPRELIPLSSLPMGFLLLCPVPDPTLGVGVGHVGVAGSSWNF